MTDEINGGGGGGSDAGSGGSDSGSSGSGGSDTASVAASVIADMDGGGSGSSDPAPVAAAADAPPAADPDDFDAVAPETTDSLGRKRVNSIPHPRVKTMIEKATRKQIAVVAKELGITKAEAELRLEDVTGALTERNTRLTQYEQRLQNVESIEAIMAGDPDRFMAMMAEVHPGYREFAKQVVQAATAAAAPDDPEPEPDFDMGDGRKTYSLEGLRKLREWDKRQAAQAARGEIEKDIAPLRAHYEQQTKREQQEAQARAVYAQASDKIEQTLVKAKQWPGFVDHGPAILEAYKARPDGDLFEAYLAVVMPAVAADRAKIREEVLADINKQGRTTSATASAAAARPTSGVRSTADLAREVMRELGA